MSAGVNQIIENARPPAALELDSVGVYAFRQGPPTRPFWRYCVQFADGSWEVIRRKSFRRYAFAFLGSSRLCSGKPGLGAFFIFSSKPGIGTARKVIRRFEVQYPEPERVTP